MKENFVSIENYDLAFERIVQDFIKLYYTYDDGSCAEYYIIGEGGPLAPDVIEVNDMYWNISDMYTAIKNCLEKDKVFEWYDYQLEKHTINSNGGDEVIFNLYHFCKGVIYTEEDKRIAKEKLDISMSLFMGSIKDYGETNTPHTP